MRGDLRNGIEGFGVDGGEGLNNGLVYGVASRDAAPLPKMAGVRGVAFLSIGPWVQAGGTSRRAN